MANIIGQVGSQSVSGTGADDIILIQETNAAGPDTVTAGGGNDVIVGDIDTVFNDDSDVNATIATALSIDDANFWSTQSNPLVGDDSIPYTTVVGEGDNAFDVFSVTIGAGETLTADIDFGDGDFGGPAFNSQLNLFDGNMTSLALNDDAPSGAEEGEGSETSSNDALLTYTNTGASPVVVFLRVEASGGTAVPLGATYLLGVSVTGHAASNNAAQGDDSISGEAGNDIIFGNGGDDTLDGGNGDDTIEGGNGADSIIGGSGENSLLGQAGNDTIEGGDDGEVLSGGAGNDVIFGADGTDFLSDGAGDDFVDGGAGNDLFVLGEGSDTLMGGAAIDSLFISTFNLLSAGDVLDGGSGTDIINVFISEAGTVDFTDVTLENWESFSFSFAFENQTAILTAEQAEQFAGQSGNSGFDVVSRSTGVISIEIELGDQTTVDLSEASFNNFLATDRMIFTGDGDAETITGTVLSDEISGNGGADALNGDLGNDSLFGGGGNDTILAGEGNDSLEGGNGNDSVFGELGSDVIVAGEGNDEVFAGNGFDLVFAGAGNDIVFGGNGQDTVFLGIGDDVFNDNGQVGDFGADTVFAGGGNDEIQGGAGADSFSGQLGSDLIFGRQGSDELFGGGGADTIFGGNGNDTVFGGNGQDSVALGNGNDVFNDNAQSGTFGSDTVFAGDGNDTIEGGAGADSFFGETGADLINAGDGFDEVFAGNGFDTVNAGNGNDTVFAGAGQDQISLDAGDDVYVDTEQTGELGQDTISGGAGADTFMFNAVMSDDVITDFEVGADTLSFAASLQGSLTNQEFVDQFASVVNGSDVVFDFGAGQSVTLEGLSSTAGLQDDLNFF